MFNSKKNSRNREVTNNRNNDPSSRGNSKSGKRFHTPHVHMSETTRQHLSRVFNFFSNDGHEAMPHHIAYFILASFMIISGVGFVYHNDHIHTIQIAKTASQSGNDDVAFSKSTNAQITVNRLKISKNHKLAYVPLHFSDMSYIPYHADNYKVYVAPAENRINYEPGGRLIMFGSSSRGCIQFYNKKGIQNTPLTVILQNDTNLTPAADKQDDADSMADAGLEYWQEHRDIAIMHVNPGARDVQVDPNIKTGLDTSQIYNELFTKSQVHSLESDDTSDRSQISIYEREVKEYRYRLRHAGFRVPSNPRWMRPGWRPFDAINKHGVPRNLAYKYKSGATHSFANYLSNDTSDGDGPDDTQYPDNLKKPDGETTDTASANQSGTGSTGSDSDNSNSPAGDWQTLQEAWTEILDYKRAIFVTHAESIYKDELAMHQQTQLASIGSNQRFIISPDPVND